MQKRTTFIAGLVSLGMIASVGCKQESDTPVPTKKPAGEIMPAAPRPPTETAPADSERPKPTLTETPADKFGIAADGFGLAVGAKAPDATLTDVTGKQVTLGSLYASGPTFVIFYRGGWCPFCNMQLHELAEAKAQFDAKGLQLVAISVDLPEEAAKTQAKAEGTAFAMLSDPKLLAHEAFGVVQSNTAEQRAKLESYGIDLAKYSGESHGNFAVPSVFLIDRDGVVKFVHVDLDYKERPSVQQMLSAAETSLAAK